MARSESRGHVADDEAPAEPLMRSRPATPPDSSSDIQTIYDLWGVAGESSARNVCQRRWFLTRRLDAVRSSRGPGGKALILPAEARRAERGRNPTF